MSGRLVTTAMRSSLASRPRQIGLPRRWAGLTSPIHGVSPSPGRACSSAIRARSTRRGDVELAEHLAQVERDGVRADEQLVGDLLVGQALGHQAGRGCSMSRPASTSGLTGPARPRRPRPPRRRAASPAWSPMPARPGSRRARLERTRSESGPPVDGALSSSRRPERNADAASGPFGKRTTERSGSAPRPASCAPSDGGPEPRQTRRLGEPPRAPARPVRACCQRGLRAVDFSADRHDGAVITGTRHSMTAPAAGSHPRHG